MSEPVDFSRVIGLHALPYGPIVLTADPEECRRLAARFGLSAIERLTATVTCIAEGDRVDVTGRIEADVIQACAISGEDFPVAIDEPVALRFVPEAQLAVEADEIELTEADCDMMPHDGAGFDLGEALAQTLALAIDPFAEGPEADRARAEHGLAEPQGSAAFAALAALRKP